MRSHYIHKSWGLCSPANLRVETLFGPASGYVAKYVNKSSGVPLLLRQPTTSTFYLSSRRPAIGCSYLRKLNILNSVKERNFKYSQIVKSKDGSVTSVPMSYPKQISGYFFPKCYRFSLLDRSQLLRIYGSNPNFSIVKQINRKYNIRSVDNPTGCLLSSVTHMFTSDEIVYGISSNRTCSRRCAAYCSTFNVSIEKYIDDLLAYYTHMSSEAFGFFVDYLNDHNFSFSTLVIAYPSSFSSLPKHVDLLAFDRSNQSLEDLLNFYGLTLSDLYLSDGSLNPICNARYSDTPEFIKFSDTVLHKKQDFEQKRLYSHMSNQLLNNYEAF